MHRRSKAKLVPLDTEIERNLRNLKKVREVMKANMAEQRDEDQDMLLAVGPQQRQ